MQLRFDFQKKPAPIVPQAKPVPQRIRLTPKQADIVYRLKFQRGTITENRETGYINLDTEKDGISWEVISRATLEALKAKGMLTKGQQATTGSNLYMYKLK